MTDENVGPVRTVFGTLAYASTSSGNDPALTLVNLLTAATVAGKMIGLTPKEIRTKLREVSGPSDAIYKKIMEITNETAPSQERSSGPAGGDAPSSS